jgi:hypothetical protein
MLRQFATLQRSDDLDRLTVCALEIVERFLGAVHHFKGFEHAMRPGASTKAAGGGRGLVHFLVLNWLQLQAPLTSTDMLRPGTGLATKRNTKQAAILPPVSAG